MADARLWQTVSVSTILVTGFEPFGAHGANPSEGLAKAVDGRRVRDHTVRGLVLAVASGALASGLGYTLWYIALPGLTATRAALVQLVVPVIAALAGVLLLEEELTQRLVVCGALILGGIGVAVLRPRRSTPHGEHDR